MSNLRGRGEGGEGGVTDPCHSLGKDVRPKAN